MNRCIAVLGGGTMGYGIALDFARFGNKVHLLDINEEALNRSIDAIKRSLQVFWEEDLREFPNGTECSNYGVIGSLTDGTIIVTSQGSYKKQLSQAMEQLRHVGANILGVIMNKVEKAEYKRYMKNYNYFTWKTCSASSPALKPPSW